MTASERLTEFGTYYANCFFGDRDSDADVDKFLVELSRYAATLAGFQAQLVPRRDPPKEVVDAPNEGGPDRDRMG